MQTKPEDQLKIPTTFWIPIIGYYLNLRILPPAKAKSRWTVVYSVLLLAGVFTAFLVPFHPVFPVKISLYYISLIDSILIFLLIAITIMETGAILLSKNPNGPLLTRLGWSRLVGRSRRFVFTTMLFFNYQEMMIGIFYVTFIFSIHMLF